MLIPIRKNIDSKTRNVTITLYEDKSDKFYNYGLEQYSKALEKNLIEPWTTRELNSLAVYINGLCENTKVTVVKRLEGNLYKVVHSNLKIENMDIRYCTEELSNSIMITEDNKIILKSKYRDLVTETKVEEIHKKSKTAVTKYNIFKENVPYTLSKSDDGKVECTIDKRAVNIEILRVPEGVQRLYFSHIGFNFKQVILPESLEEIGNNAFIKCRELTEIKIPNRVSKIGSLAFYMSEKLKVINIPNNLEKLDNTFLDGCNSVTLIINRGCKLLRSGKISLSNKRIKIKYIG